MVNGRWSAGRSYTRPEDGRTGVKKKQQQPEKGVAPLLSTANVFVQRPSFCDSTWNEYAVNCIIGIVHASALLVNLTWQSGDLEFKTLTQPCDADDLCKVYRTHRTHNAA